MKKLFALSAFLVVSATAASLSPSSVLLTPAATLKAACDQGFKEGTDGTNSGYTRYVAHLLASQGESGMVVQSGPGSAYSQCSSAAQGLKDKPAHLSSVLLVTQNGQVEGELAQARQWAVVLALKDGSGRELGRIQPTFAQKGTLEDWKPDCSTDPCTWTGVNYYSFDSSQYTRAQLALIKKAVFVDVLASAGEGVQKYRLDSTNIHLK